MTSYLVSIVATAGIYALLALGLNVVWGMTGMINLGLAGFFAVGAYGSAIATTAAGLPIAAGVAVGFAAAAAAGALPTLQPSYRSAVGFVAILLVPGFRPRDVPGQRQG